MIDPIAPKHSLPPCLRVPVAAANIEAIERYAGRVLELITSRDRHRASRVNAMLVQPHVQSAETDPQVKLWQLPDAAAYRSRLFPDHQVWVHVDYSGYRRAYRRFGLPVPDGCFLDHVQNREAMRLRTSLRVEAAARGYDVPSHGHPYLRLCPVDPAVNTSGGVDQGGEGMEKAYLRGLRDGLERGDVSPTVVERALRAFDGQIVYADPMDLTKMLNVQPGTMTLPGVRDTHELLFP